MISVSVSAQTGQVSLTGDSYVKEGAHQAPVVAEQLQARQRCEP